MKEDEPVRTKPSVLPAREAIALIGEPPESEPADDESGEPATDAGDDPSRS